MRLNIVGTKYRGAAIAALVGTLPLGFPLELEREPLNPVDPNAIKVTLPEGWGEHLTSTQLQEAREVLEASNFERVDDQSFWTEPLHIGYIAKEIAEQMAPQLDNGVELEALQLSTDAAGRPTVWDEQDDDTQAPEGADIAQRANASTTVPLDVNTGGGVPTEHSTGLGGDRDMEDNAGLNPSKSFSEDELAEMKEDGRAGTGAASSTDLVDDEDQE